MNSSLELAPGTTDHPLPEWNADTVQALLDQLNRQAAETTRLNAALKLAEAKNQALTLELAHLRRLRFGAKSEALSAEQRDLFQETLEADIAACEAEAEAAAPEAKPRAKRPHAGPCRASSTGTNPSPVAAASVAASGSPRVRTSPCRAPLWRKG